MVGLVPRAAPSRTVLYLPLAVHVVYTECTAAGIDGPVYAVTR